MRASLLLAGAASGFLLCAASAQAQPAQFPDVDSFPAVDPVAYQVQGGHPSTSGWAFTTPAGLRCQNGLIPDLGIVCRGLVPGSPTEVMTVSVSLTKPAEFSRSEGDLEDPWSPPLPAGSKFAAGNGVVCAVPDDVTFACRAAKPDSWPAGTQDPPDRHYGEHGFVVSPGGNWTY